MTLPLALEGGDIIGQAKTGTGKTLGFGIPLIDRTEGPSASGKPQALVVVPTRELALQVADDLTLASAGRKIRVLVVYGGRGYEPQIAALRAGVEVVVGTPGRLLDLQRQKFLKLDEVRILVLDEADEMLDMGFLPDVEKLISEVNPNRQTMLFSATMPGSIVNLARRYMTKPTHIRAVDPANDSSLVDAIEQHVWRTHQMDKIEVLARILQANGRGRSIIFTRTKRAAQRVCDELIERGFKVDTVHGDLGQGARERAMTRFRDGTVDVLVATDVAARGLDIEDVTHVINHECPEDDKAYLHRIGRTGRAGASGTAVTFVDWSDMARWKMINKTLGLPFSEPLETYSSSDHIYAGLNIPKEVSGRVGYGPKPKPKQKTARGGAGNRSVGRKAGSGRGGEGSGRKSNSGGIRARSSGPRSSANPSRSERPAPKSQRNRQRVRRRVTKPAK